MTQLDPSSEADEVNPEASPSALTRLVDRFMAVELHAASVELRRQHRTFILFILLMVPVGGGLGLIHLRGGNFAAASSEAIAVGLNLGTLFYLRRGGALPLAVNLGLGSMLLVLWTACWYGNGLAYGAMVFFPVMPVVALLTVGGRWGRVWAMVAAGAIVGLYVAERQFWLPLPFDSEFKRNLMRAVDAVAAVGVSFGLARAFNSVKDYALDLVEQRSLQLARVNTNLEELFHNMRQGVIAFGEDGRVTGKYSEQATQIFGRPSLAGCHVVDDLLAAHLPSWEVERQLLDTLVSTSFAVPPDVWPMVVEEAPARMVVRSGGADGAQRHLALEYRPIVENAQTVRVMILVTDETEQVKREAEARAREQEHARKLAAVRRMLAGGAHVFAHFLEHAESGLRKLRDLLVEDARIGAADLREGFRAVHTLKADARTFELLQLEACCHEVEELLARWTTARGQASESAPPEEEVGRARGATEQALLHIEGAREQLVKAAPGGRAVLAQVPVEQEALSTLVRSVDDIEALTPEGAAPQISMGSSDVRGHWRTLVSASRRLASRPFGETASPLVTGMERWAEHEEKQARLELEGKDIAIEEKASGVLRGALTHLVRNALVHGLERPEERVAQGKESWGVVTVRCSEHPHFCIEVRDDGRGVDVAALCERASAQGLAVVKGQELDLLFCHGLSTRGYTDELAGRGVGLDAVRSSLAQVGLCIHVRSEPGRGTCFTIEAPAERAQAATGT